MSSPLLLYRPCSNILCGVVSDHQNQLDEMFTTESSVTYNYIYNSRAIIDYANSYPFASKYADGWVTVGIKDYFLLISHYAISQRIDGYDEDYLTGWFFEGSLDNNTWTILDQRKNMTSISSQ